MPKRGTHVRVFSQHGNSKNETRKKVMFSIARSASEKNQHHWLVGKISTSCSNVTEVDQWATLSCSRPQPTTYNGVRNGRSNWWPLPPTLMGSTYWTPRAQYKSVHPLLGIDPATYSIRGNHLEYAATQGVYNLCRVYHYNNKQFSIITLPNQNNVDARRAKKQVSFSMAIENVELMYQC